jgi:SAM-dependent methyltransferase
MRFILIVLILAQFTPEEQGVLDVWNRREAWQDPALVLGALHLRPGLEVADLGAGKGYFTWRLARAVAPGKVLALDIDPYALSLNTRIAEKLGVTNIETRTVERDDPGLAPGEADLIFVSRTWHLLPDRIRYVQILREGLAKDGRLAVLDSNKDSRPRPPGQTDRYQVQREAEAAGFVLLEEHDLPKQFLLVLGRGRAPVFDAIDGFTYVTGNLAVGRAAPDSTGFALLGERGFLGVLDAGSGGDARGGGAAERAGFAYRRIPIDARDRVAALAAFARHQESGIVYAWSDSLGVLAGNFLEASEAGLLPLTRTEKARLESLLSTPDAR